MPVVTRSQTAATQSTISKMVNTICKYVPQKEFVTIVHNDTLSNDAKIEKLANEVVARRGDKISSKPEIGGVYNVTITKINSDMVRFQLQQFLGYYVSFDDFIGIKGFVMLSDAHKKRPTSPKQMYKVGKTMRARVLRADDNRGYYDLSFKCVM